jgi:hypothetical protein
VQHARKKVGKMITPAFGFITDGSNFSFAKLNETKRFGFSRTSTPSPKRTSENTTHMANGAEAPQTILDWNGHRSEYKLLVLMLIGMWSVIREQADTSLRRSMENFQRFSRTTRERLTELLSDMRADSTWEVRAKRPFAGGPGAKLKTTLLHLHQFSLQLDHLSYPQLSATIF